MNIPSGVKNRFQLLLLLSGFLSAQTVLAKTQYEFAPRVSYYSSSDLYVLDGSDSPPGLDKSDIKSKGVMVGIQAKGFGHVINRHMLNAFVASLDYGVLETDFVMQAGAENLGIDIINNKHVLLKVEDTVSFYDLPWAGFVPFVGVGVKGIYQSMPEELLTQSHYDSNAWLDPSQSSGGLVDRFTSQARYFYVPLGITLRFGDHLILSGRYDYMFRASSDAYYTGVKDAKLDKGHALGLDARWDFGSSHNVAAKLSWHKQDITFKEVDSPVTSYKSEADQVTLSFIWES